ncbi:craniofacial development protein 2-like [Nylanderia fulva]|uniref:craniofacial development protein 2-like n=1 Tax=Nylanderia fulva TaxID=613905 RepID=UPI0010FB4A56|nr:craniofacial development protein 2-like [Nylanderia fulva]
MVKMASTAGELKSRADLSVYFKDSGGGKNPIARKRNSRKNQKKLWISTYNIQTMRLDEHLEELEHELQLIKWSVLGICETRLMGEVGTVLKSGHMLYQNNSINNTHNGGVAIMVHKNLKHLVTKTRATSERVIYIVMKLNQRYTIQVIQVYAPTTTAEDKEIEHLYEDVSTARRAEKAKFTVVMEDFNAKMGPRTTEDLQIIGPYGLGVRNSRDQMLLDYLGSENLFCMNTFFKKSPQRKWTWKSPNNLTKNEIDYILTNTKEICTDVSVLNKFYIGSDHYLVRATILINIKRERHKLMKTKTFRPILKELELKQLEYQETLQTKLQPQDLAGMNINKLSERITRSIQIATKKLVHK